MKTYTCRKRNEAGQKAINDNKLFEYKVFIKEQTNEK